MYASFSDSSIVVQNTNSMQDVSEISLSMTYNPELLNLELPSSSSPDITYTVIENTP
jgi:hypothetical protein